MEDILEEALALPAAGKLTARNYRHWARRMSCRLRALGLWNITEGTEERPTADSTSEDKKALKEWEKRDAIARMLLFDCLSATQLSLISDESTAKEIWDRLKEFYRPTGFFARMGIMRRLLAYKAKPTDSILTIASTISGMVEDLQEAGSQKLSTDMQIFLLFNALPPQYEGITRLIINTPGEDPTWEEVVTKLRGEEILIRMEKDCRALAAKRTTKNTTSRRKPVPYSELICFSCQQKGHIARHCSQN